MRLRIRRLVSVAAVLALIASITLIGAPAMATVFTNPGIPSGNDVTPAVQPGFPGCPEGLETYTWEGTGPGTQTTPAGSQITIERSDGPLPGRDNRYFDFSISGGTVGSVIVKTDVFIIGFITESTVYSYEEPTTDDTRLHPPTDRWNRPFQLSGIRFCYTPEISISGVKYEDTNANGVRDDDETGVAGVEITLSQGDTRVASTTTDADGTYSFDGLAPGTYTVCEVLGEGEIQSQPGGDGCYTVSGTTTDADFGNYRNATISGTKFEDLDANGARGEGDPGLPEWTITATDGDVPVSDTTGMDGGYSLEVKPGTYSVCEVLQDGWIQSVPGTESGCYENVTVGSGETVGGKDFGNYRLGSISGTRLLNGGTPGIPNLGVELRGELTESSLTGPGGTYSFVDLPPGSYELCTENLTESVDGTQTPSELSPADCSEGEVGYSITLESGDAITADFDDVFPEDTEVFVGLCNDDAFTTGGGADPEGNASGSCRLKDSAGSEIEIAAIYTSGFGDGGLGGGVEQFINLEIIGAEQIDAQFIETLSFQPDTGFDGEPELLYDIPGFEAPRVAQFCDAPVAIEDLPLANPGTVLPDGEALCIVSRSLDSEVTGLDQIQDTVTYVVFWTEDIRRGVR